ncbi:MAG: GMC family oxidoreductase [Spongiibacteraceae bacterium]|nr:GMC family oxidoreductase [Spongiibacteraceae bacterium]
MPAVFDKNDSSVVVIIGSGAGGGTLAGELTKAGVNVVCLEAGKPVDSVVNDAAAMFPKLTWLDKRIGSGDLAKDFPVWSGKNVGGTTLHWTASTPRLSARELKPTRYFSSLSDTSVVDWPIDADEMAKYYSIAEQRMGVSGTNEWPKLPANNHFRVLQAGAKKIGVDAHIGNMAINSVVRGDRAACMQLGFCVSGCAVQAKWTAANTPIAQAQATKHFELRDQSFVQGIEHDKNGRVNAVIYIDNKGIQQRQKARVVCVAANSIDTPRILLNSDSSHFKNGLANSAGHVGRHYIKHVFSVVSALMPHPVNFHRGTQNIGRVSAFSHSDQKRGFAGGFEFEQVSFDPATLTRLARPGRWGKNYAKQLSKYDHFAALLITGEDPAQHSNGIRLHETQKDQYGMPVPVVHYVDHPNSKKLREYAQQKAKALYQSLGSEDVFFGPPPPATHNLGTCRMSVRPEDGVSNAYGQTHDIPNLFVSDGSQFCSSGTANPTLTIVTLALRQADYIKQQLQQAKI